MDYSHSSQAEKLGTKTINEDEFYEVIKNTPGKKSSYEPAAEQPPAKKPKTSVTESPLTKTSTIKASRESPCSSQGEALNSQKSVSSVASPMTQTPSGSPSIKGTFTCIVLVMISHLVLLSPTIQI
jgi:hypothetical protein